MPVQTQLQIRRDTATNWSSTNPTLASGEWGLETDTRQYKIGDGVTAWNSLGYQLGPLLDEDIATDPNGAYFDGTGLKVFGVNQNYASAPDSVALSITGDIDIRVKVALDDWTPATINALVSKWTFSGNRLSYAFYVNTNGTLRLLNSADGLGPNRVERSSTVATGFTDGATKWVRATLDVDNGASGNDATFYTSDDGVTWTQLGNVVTLANTTSIFDSTLPLEIGSSEIGQFPAKGTIYRAQVLNGINGTTAFDANFETVPADSFAFTESSANAATVTLTTTRYSFGLPNSTMSGTTTESGGTNTTYYVPFTVKGKPITLKHLAFESATTPASNSTVRIAIYAADTQLQPSGNAIIQSGAITVASAAAAIYRIRVTPTTLKPGNYLLLSNTSVAFNYRAFLSGTNAFAVNTLGANLNYSWRLSQTLSSDFPNPQSNWNSRATINGPGRAYVLLGWS